MNLPNTLHIVLQWNNNKLKECVREIIFTKHFVLIKNNQITVI